MKEENFPFEAIVFLQVDGIANIANQKLGACKVRIYLRSTRQPVSSRVELVSRQCLMQEPQEEMGTVGLALCRKDDCIEIELQEESGSKTSAYSKIPLDKLIEIPNVRHQIECLMV